MSLKQAFGSLNPNMILETRVGAHQVRTWLNQLNGKLSWETQIKSDIYNEGRLEIHAFEPGYGHFTAGNLSFYQKPITEKARSLHERVGTL